MNDTIQVKDDSPRFEQVPLQYTRSDSFETLFANNLSLESNIWNIRLIFGELLGDAAGSPIVEQHTSISMPWTQAKIACFYLAMNIIGYEGQNGPIRIPPAALPLITGLTEAGRSNPRIMAVLTAVMGEGNPEIFVDKGDDPEQR